jgi:DNA-binding LytR/AlgR family response regulator
MPEYRALIAEDEPLLAAALATDLRVVWPDLRIAAQVGDGLSAVEQALALRPDVCFLDIRMPGCTGLEAAQALIEDWPDSDPLPLLVFVTAYDQYAVQAFETQAVDYLIKPTDRGRLRTCVERLQQRLGQRLGQRSPEPGLPQMMEQLRGLLAAPASSLGGPVVASARLEVIQAQTGSTVHFVPVDEVIYFEAADKYVRVLTQDKEHLIRLSLRELLPQLDAQRFWQVHRGTIVQARCIMQARRDESGKVYLSLRGRPETITASRLYAHLFKGM